MKTPVAVFIFNRPDLTRRVFARIAQAKPQRLLLVADGPRADRIDDAALVAATRKVVEQVDWPCEVLRNYSDTNLGCRNRVSSGLDWVFESVEEAIILEDDCLPDASFFPYCVELLERYRDNPRVMHIGGNNFWGPRVRLPHSYCFSRYAHIWGWATWRRAWKLYDRDMRQWPGPDPQDVLGRALRRRDERRYWAARFDLAKAGRIDTWDFAWLFTCWAADGVAITPRVNLVTNLGFGGDSTHTPDGGHAFANMAAASIESPLIHPPRLAVDRRLERLTFRTVFEAPLSPKEKLQLARWTMGKALRRLLRFPVSKGAGT